MSEPPLTFEDFASCEWQKVIFQAEKKTIDHYSHSFGLAMQQSMDAGEITRARAFRFLTGVTSMRRTFDSESHPYAEAIKLADGTHSMNLDDIGATEVTLIERLAPEISDPELKALFHDLLWIKKRSHTAARLAIGYFLESAAYLENHEHWREYVARLKRATALAASLGRKQPELETVHSRISETINRVSATDEGFVSHELMLILIGVKLGDTQKWAQLCETLARRAQAAGKWPVARAYWKMKGDWHVRGKNDHKKVNEARLKAAETYVSESESVLAAEKPARAWATGLLANAVEALRNAGASPARVEEIHRRLLELQSAAMQEMKSFATHEVDISEHVKYSQGLVRSKPLRDAIDVLCRCMTAVAESDVRERVLSSMKHFLFIHLFGKEFVDTDGKVIARRPGAVHGSSEPSEDVVRAEMEEAVRLDYDFRFHTYLQPMIEIIYSEHGISIRDLDFLVQDNEFIPIDRRNIFARGLLAGFHCDWLIAAHLLVPQIENSIRQVLSKRGFVTSKLNSHLLQEEDMLDSLLNRPETKEIFGSDFVFNLRALLISKYGNNFRHDLAHGLVGEPQCYSVEVVQIWWLILRLCNTIFLLGEQARSASSETTPPATD